MSYKVGDVVILTHSVYEAASEDGPAGYLAEVGDLLIVRAVRDSGTWPISVSHEGVTGSSFNVKPEEIAPWV